MSKILIYISVTVFGAILFSCELSQEQEQNLSAQLTNFMKARNTGNALKYANLTHPIIVKDIESQGQKAMKDRFDVVLDYSEEYEYYNLDSNYYWFNPYQKSIVIDESDANNIHALYEFKFKQGYEVVKDTSLLVVAMTTDGGTSWLFAEENDYFTDKYPSLPKLIEKP